MTQNNFLSLLPGSIRTLFTLFTSGLLFACTTAISPLGRTQLTLLDDSEMESMGMAAFSELKQEKKATLSSNSTLNEYIRCIAKPLVNTLGTSPQYMSRAIENENSTPETVNRTNEAIAKVISPKIEDWEIVVIDDPKEVNAFAIPGRKIGVYTGILSVAKTTDQLATVMAHEITHVAARHGNENMTRVIFAQGGILAGMSIAELFDAFGSEDRDSEEAKTKREATLALMGLTVSATYLNPHSREQESEADLVGVRLMAHAGFNPNEAPQLWKNMKSLSGSEVPEFLSTHPSHETRITDIQNYIQKNAVEFAQAQATTQKVQCVRPAGF